jgi:hypothetical protein
VKEVGGAPILQEMNDPKSFNDLERYMDSKIMEMYLVREIAEHADVQGVVLNAANPGWCHSGVRSRAVANSH